MSFFTESKRISISHSIFKCDVSYYELWKTSFLKKSSLIELTEKQQQFYKNTLNFEVLNISKLCIEISKKSAERPVYVYDWELDIETWSAAATLILLYTIFFQLYFWK